MKNIFTRLILIAVLALLPAMTIVGTAIAASPSCGKDSSSKGQILQGVGATGSDCDDSGITEAAATVVNILSVVVGIAAIIMIIYSGFRYITSAGDTGRVTSAKNTLIYALIGLVIAGLAQFLVHFVLNQASLFAK